MTLDEALLEKLDEWKPDLYPDRLAVKNQAGLVEVTLGQLDTLGCQLWDFRVTRQSDETVNRPLKEWALKVAGCVTGLLEPLQVLEVDADKGLAILRSKQPAKKDGKLFYYELILHSDGMAELHRYQGAFAEGKREQVGFVITREAMAKLALDLATL
jgi:hypothetical protein